MLLTGPTEFIYSDYSPEYELYSIVFDVCNRIVCINRPVFNDNHVENDGTIHVRLEPRPLISYNVSELMIKVQDDDDGE